MFELIKLEYNSPEYRQSLVIRQEVLRKPLGLLLTDEDISEDAQQIHLGAMLDQQLIGSVSLQPVQTKIVKLRQMAIAFSHQGKGIGAKLLQYAEEYALSQGYQEIQLHARCYCRGFYEKFGYQSQGETFLEVTIPHIFMYKKLYSAT